MTQLPEKWSFKLPSIQDLDNDPVTLTVNFGDANFIQVFGTESLNITDVSMAAKLARAGSYTITFTLDDGNGKSIFSVLCLVFVAPASDPIIETTSSNIPIINESNFDPSLIFINETASPVYDDDYFDLQEGDLSLELQQNMTQILEELVLVDAIDTKNKTAVNEMQAMQETLIDSINEQTNKLLEMLDDPNLT